LALAGQGCTALKPRRAAKLAEQFNAGVKNGDQLILLPPVNLAGGDKVHILPPECGDLGAVTEAPAAYAKLLNVGL
jgi:hypothetical protein